MTKRLFIALLLLCNWVFILAQTTAVVPADAKAVKYRRSSLYMVMLDDKGLVNAEVIKSTFMSMPIPEKFNDHTLPIRSFDPSTLMLTEEEKKSAEKKGGKFGSFTKSLANGATGGLVDTTDTKYLPLKIDKFFNENNIARDLVAKWFNRSEKGTFNMNLIGERGSYDASALDISAAKSSARGISAIADAGEELIGNTFVVVTRFNYVSMESITAATQKLGNFAMALAAASGNTVSAEVKQATDSIAKQITGYAVQTTSHLYKLVWNDSIEAVFYQNYWIDDNSFDPAKKAAFDTTKLFTLELIGDERANASILEAKLSNKSQDELVTKATVNAFDAVLAKLQRKYEIFRTKTPLYSGDPITAKIGLKEGLEPGDKFEVLEQRQDPKTGKTTYEKVGKIKVERGMIWDNRFGAEDETVKTGVEGAAASGTTPASKIDRTTFSGPKGLYTGMLIRQKN
ncbi:MAG: hypothetical protein IPL10_04285 [Bacteroidetes bacterium]|nr:hypothetical protein [Bacteroidota bacterium]